MSERPPHILLADIGMPGEDGYALIRKMRASADERLARLPAVALTAFGREEDRLRALEAGFQRHLSKPVFPDELVAVIVSILGLKAVTSS
jgi:CheY-like chemotaxis protein